MNNNPTGINQYSAGVRSAYKSIGRNVSSSSSTPISKKARAGLANSIRQMRSGNSPVIRSTLIDARASTAKRNFSNWRSRMKAAGRMR